MVSPEENMKLRKNLSTSISPIFCWRFSFIVFVSMDYIFIANSSVWIRFGLYCIGLTSEHLNMSTVNLTKCHDNLSKADGSNKLKRGYNRGLFGANTSIYYPYKYFRKILRLSEV